MSLGKKLISTALSIITFLTAFTQIIQAKSVYVITDHGGSTITAYDINGDAIKEQIEINVGWGNGAVGLALDPDSATLFISYDNSNKIELINARTMTEIKYIATPVEFAGIVFDKTNQRLLALQREEDQLYIYQWYALSKSLVLDGPSKTLPNVSDGYGITLDENENRLYVTDATNIVKIYDTTDLSFAYKGSIDIVVDSNDRKAVGIDFYDDGQSSKYLYTGGYDHQGLNNFLVRTDITDINNPSFTEKDIGSSVIGVAADQDTGLVYVTTTNDHIEVYNNATFPSDPCYIDDDPNISGPADICLAGDVSYKPPLLSLEKIDVNEPNSVLPGDYITYEITYGPNGFDHNNVVITDYLSYKVDFEDSDPNYNPDAHTYTWVIGDLNAADPNDSVTLTVRANEGADPNGIITNFCEIESDSAYIYVTADTNIGFWQPDSNIIYVDDASKCLPGTGMSWRSAYVDLQDALARAASGCGSEIWVAAGTYKPSVPEGAWATFELINGVAMYGGFAGTETNRSQRSWITNETILSGNTSPQANYVVTGADNAILNGFTITDACYFGVYCDVSDANMNIAECCIIENNNVGVRCNYQSSVNITDCKIQNNDREGIRCDDCNVVNITDCLIESNYWSGVICSSCDLNIINCTIKGNSRHGIYCSGNSANIANCTIEDNHKRGVYIYNKYLSSIITNNIIRGNDHTGIRVDYGKLIVKNNWICNNGTEDSHYGIYLKFPDSERTVVRNNTIANSTGYGIYYRSSSSNISNCIVWGENPFYETDYNVTYSCIQDGYGNPDDHNIDDDPCFVDAANNNYHLTSDSNCIDAGYPDANYPNETDIDGEPRIFDGDGDGNDRVDMGADEFYWSSADFNHDEAVNFLDYAELANNWQKTDDVSDYNDIYDLEDNNSIDYNDLAIFCEDWLWQPAWTKTPPCGCGMGYGMGYGYGFGFGQGHSQAVPAKQLEQQPVEIEPPDIEELIDWLDGLWFDGDLREYMTKDEYLEFRKAIQKSIE